jgi:hypothetical protein
MEIFDARLNIFTKRDAYLFEQISKSEHDKEIDNISGINGNLPKIPTCRIVPSKTVVGQCALSRAHNAYARVHTRA